jgi:hypothetical protein
MTKQRKTECQVIFMLLVISLLLQEVDREAGDENAKNPAVDQCTRMMDDLLARVDEQTRRAMIERIQQYRVRFTKKVANITTTSGLIGALRLLCGGFVRSKPGTRLNYIIQTFAGNLSNMEKLIPFKEDDANKFFKEFKLAVTKIGGNHSKSV